MSGCAPPTLAGFQDFLYGVMKIDPLYLPSTEPVIGYAYQVALGIVNPALRSVPIPSPTGGPGTTVYALAVYNLAGSNVVQFAQDQDGRDYFMKLRATLGIDKFSPGIVASTSDASTSTALLNPEFMKTLTLQNLQNLRDPWGRQYLAFAMSAGPTIWGLS
jgi:hypothetical protein